MKTHNLNVTVDAAKSLVTVSDPKRHIDSGDQVIWKISETPSLSGGTLDLNLCGTVTSTTLSGAPTLTRTISRPGSKKGDVLPYSFVLTEGGVTKNLTLVAPSPTDPNLVLDTSGPPIGGCPREPKDPSGRGVETRDCP
ncbi:MAG TPA: hypothetical protein VGH73_10030 [Thermoanaerobaculia bacterium]|jgi:hypothetical protein